MRKEFFNYDLLFLTDYADNTGDNFFNSLHLGGLNLFDTRHSSPIILGFWIDYDIIGEKL